jgi:hypothetical protein
MTASALRSISSVRSALLSNALSAMSAANSLSVISGATPTLS